MKNYTVSRATADQHYAEILRLAVELGMQCLFVVRRELGLSLDCSRFLEKCHPYVISKTLTREWPGTVLLGGELAEVFKCELNQVIIKIFLEVSRGFESWRQPNMPEDLCILRSNGEPWLVSITHEHDYYLLLDEQELRAIQKKLPLLLSPY